MRAAQLDQPGSPVALIDRRTLLEEGFRPGVTPVAPLDEAGLVLDALERRQLAGKAVLRP